MLPASPERRFLLLIVVAVLMQVLLSLSNYFNKIATAYLSAKAQTYVTGKTFERIMTFSYDCVSRYKVGDLVLFANDSALAVDRQITLFNDISVGLSFSIVYLIVIVRLSPILAIAAAILTLLVALIQFNLLPRLRRIVRRVTDTQVESAKYITENIQALRLLHTFGTQKNAVSTANKLLVKTQQQLQKRAFLFYLAEPHIGCGSDFSAGITRGSSSNVSIQSGCSFADVDHLFACFAKTFNSSKVSGFDHYSLC